ncbi:exported hypothetical protein [Desulfamplus magnetovallimortis]|uniref:Uncharacterized protein n=1 Tax=Desulfamplus magnetovallimortis TaxID=1246637 RepID=A0A1W1HGH0_9BACT|nr:TAXI family TRAP transporter solute-binding subunit [Desulfamplus magnetovallimortis]SLM31488.1 exported hypothetical protein [Desulfamplus magnetovallimortis]
MKRISLSICVIFVLGLLFSANSFAADRIFFGIATGGTGGTYYPLGGMLAQMISNNVDINGKKTLCHSRNRKCISCQRNSSWP